jgi:CrcB protein
MGEKIRLYAYVAAGSAFGAVLRWLLSVGALALAGDGFAWGTLVANVTGSAAIGFYARYSGPDGRAAPAHVRHMVMTGVLGGYTTFSMFSLECLLRIQAGAWAEAGLYIALSLASWIGAVWLGDALAARVIGRTGAPT